jgi:GntR family transcriptional regulator, transcriptional repressor for pyruvate dehydrogenase complex
MAKLRKAKKLSLVEDVVDQIEEAIMDGEYKPGDKLPSTRQLQEIFDASMGTIRESLAILDQKGLLTVRKGAKGGYFIREITTQPMTESLELLMRHMSLPPRELFEFRATLEAGVIRLVVQRANDEQIKLFMGYLDKFKSCLHKGQAGWLRLVEFEQDLRKEFLKVIRNRFYEAVLLPINNGLLKYAVHNLPWGHKEAQDAYDYWKKILSAVAERDENQAATLVKELLFHFMNLILEYLEKAK